LGETFFLLAGVWAMAGTISEPASRNDSDMNAVLIFTMFLLCINSIHFISVQTPF
jgi:hypothetical protein